MLCPSLKSSFHPKYPNPTIFEGPNGPFSMNCSLFPLVGVLSLRFWGLTLMVLGSYLKLVFLCNMYTYTPPIYLEYQEIHKSFNNKCLLRTNFGPNRILVKQQKTKQSLCLCETCIPLGLRDDKWANVWSQAVTHSVDKSEEDGKRESTGGVGCAMRLWGRTFQGRAFQCKGPEVRGCLRDSLPAAEWAGWTDKKWCQREQGVRNSVDPYKVFDF